MHLDGDAQGERGIKEPLGLMHIEGDPLAKDVHRINKPLGTQCGQPLTCNGVNVLIRSGCEFRWQGVRGEERRLYRDGKALTELARRPQHLRLIRKRQSVAGFDLNRRHAFSQQRGEARSCAIDQFFKTCLPRRPHGGEDPTAARRDLGIARPAQALRVFARPCARENEVRVTIDQARGQPNALKIMAFKIRAAQLNRLLPRHSDPIDVAIAYRDGAFFNHAHALIAGGYARVVPEAYGVGIRRFRRFRHDPPMLAVPWRFIASVAYSCRRNAPGEA